MKRCLFLFLSVALLAGYAEAAGRKQTGNNWNMEQIAPWAGGLYSSFLIIYPAIQSN